MDRAVRIALAGMSQGYYATHYTRFLALRRDVEVVAICDEGKTTEYVQECAFITSRELAQELKVPLVHAYSQLLDMEPEAVLICSETADHAWMAREALERGIYVFVSKPLCFSTADIQLLEGIFDIEDRLLCGNPLKYELGITELRRRLMEGEIGRPYSWRIMVNHQAMIHQDWERNEQRSGGPLGTYGVYLFDLARWLSGKPLQCVYALGGNYATPQIRCPDTVKVLGESEDGSLFVLELFSGIYHPYPFIAVEAVGEKGVLRTCYDNYATISQTQGGTELGTLREEDMGAKEMEHFLQVIRNGIKVRCGLSDMRYTVNCIEATGKSLLNGREIRIGGKGVL